MRRAATSAVPVRPPACRSRRCMGILESGCGNSRRKRRSSTATAPSPRMSRLRAAGSMGGLLQDLPLQVQQESFQVIAGAGHERFVEEPFHGGKLRFQHPAVGELQDSPASPAFHRISGANVRMRLDPDTRPTVLSDVRTSPGKPLPFGATPNGHGTQFSVFSRHATAVSLLLFDSPQDSRPAREIELDPRLNRTGRRVARPGGRRGAGRLLPLPGRRPLRSPRRATGSTPTSSSSTPT